MRRPFRPYDAFRVIPKQKLEKLYSGTDKTAQHLPVLSVILIRHFIAATA
jgi:hypothetical protein